VLQRNQAAEDKLRNIVGKRHDDESPELTVKDISKLNSEFFQAFARVRTQVDLIGTPVPLPTKKGRVDQVLEETVEAGQESQYLIKWAFECREDPVIAQDSGLPPTIVYQPAVFPAPRFLTERKISESTFQILPLTLLPAGHV
jgi:hypothetical protein